MATTVTDAKTAALAAQLEIQLAMQEFQAEWFAPDVRRVQGVADQQMLNQWDARAPEIAQVAEQQPAVYDRANKTIGAIRKRLKGG